MTNHQIDAIVLTRKIREQHYEQLKEKTPEERLAFYRALARELHQRVSIPAEPLPSEYTSRSPS